MSETTQNSLSLSAQAMGVRAPSYLDDLNPAQREAVEQLDGPVLILAGAGTGKTKALTSRIAHLLHSGRARPNEIMAVTFTNKAAREMKDRVARLLGQPVEGFPWLGTFHAIGVKLLRRHAELVGLKSSFTILDTDDQLRLMKQVIAAYNLDEKRFPPRALAGLIDTWKNRGWTPDAIPSSEVHAMEGKGIELYAFYQRRLMELNACDFGDLLLHVVRIFKENPDVLAKYHSWIRYIMVDEYQDTNTVQYMWLRLLAQAHHNVCCVGDDDQSIYGWRGAEVGNILRFEKDFDGAKIVRLEQNYRSTEHILAAASHVIDGNSERLGKTLWTAAQGGEKLRLIGHWDGEEEARWIGEEIEALQRGTRGMAPMSLDHMAILVRASHQMRLFEDRFLTIGLPYRVIGGPRFYERMEIRDAMAYYRLALSPSNDLAFERIINTPKRGLGDKAQQRIQMRAREDGVPLLEAARRMVADGAIGGKGGRELGVFVDNFGRWVREAAQEGGDHIAFAERVLEESGYTEMWQREKSPEAAGRLENLKELMKALEGFENLSGFLEHVSLVMDNEGDQSGEQVSIMTLHGAKGLEFPAVFLPGWEEGLFPSQRSMDESGVQGLEEERRLAYVGITRAEELCTITFSSNRRIYGQWQNAVPSRFIDELPAEHVDVLTPSGLNSAGMTSSLHDAAASANVYNSPGWGRLQSRITQRGLSQPREGAKLIAASTSVPQFELGQRVFHQKFGYGFVQDIEGDKLIVEFETSGSKHLLAKFVTAGDDVPF